MSIACDDGQHNNSLDKLYAVKFSVFSTVALFLL